MPLRSPPALLSALVACVACGDDLASRAGAADAGGMMGGRDSDASLVDMERGDAQADVCVSVVEEILVTCGNIVCHDPFSGGIGVDLDLSRRDALPQSLVGQAATDACDGAPYIDPDEPERSLLLRKLAPDPSCGERMPAGDRPPLDGTQRACFEAWVLEAAGERRNGG